MLSWARTLDDHGSYLSAVMEAWSLTGSIIYWLGMPMAISFYHIDSKYHLNSSLPQWPVRQTLLLTLGLLYPCNVEQRPYVTEYYFVYGGPHFRKSDILFKTTELNHIYIIRAGKRAQDTPMTCLMELKPYNQTRRSPICLWAVFQL